MKKELTFENILNTCRNIFMADYSFQNWVEFKDYLINNELEVKKALNKATINQLNRFARKDKKSNMVSSVYSSLLSTLNLSDTFSYSPMDETYKQAFIRITSKYTESDFYTYKEAKKVAHEAKVKAFNNPETLEEFRTFISYKGETALSVDQKIIYKELVADTKKTVEARQEEQKAEVLKR